MGKTKYVPRLRNQGQNKRFPGPVPCPEQGQIGAFIYADLLSLEKVTKCDEENEIPVYIWKGTFKNSQKWIKRKIFTNIFDVMLCLLFRNYANLKKELASKKV